MCDSAKCETPEEYLGYLKVDNIGVQEVTAERMVIDSGIFLFAFIFSRVYTEHCSAGLTIFISELLQQQQQLLLLPLSLLLSILFLQKNRLDLL